MSKLNEGFSKIVPVMAISNLVLTQQIYSEQKNGAHAHYREPVPLSWRGGGGVEEKLGGLQFFLGWNMGGLKMPKDDLGGLQVSFK